MYLYTEKTCRSWLRWNSHQCSLSRTLLCNRGHSCTFHSLRVFRRHHTYHFHDRVSQSPQHMLKRTAQTQKHCFYETASGFWKHHRHIFIRRLLPNSLPHHYSLVQMSPWDSTLWWSLCRTTYADQDVSFSCIATGNTTGRNEVYHILVGETFFLMHWQFCRWRLCVCACLCPVVLQFPTCYG